MDVIRDFHIVAPACLTVGAVIGLLLAFVF
jgi:hypothetical protein